MHLPLDIRELHARQSNKSSSKPSNTPVLIGLLVASLVILILALLFFQTRTLRLKHSNPRFLPTQYLKNKWRAWSPRSKYDKISRPSTSRTARSLTSINDNSTRLTTTITTSTQDTSYAPSTEIPTSSSAEVDRRTSVRSIMTLPPYRFTPQPGERLIAREGEREGVDTVIEYPESETEVEARREEEMGALFAIRQARRREAEAREERRRERREARERGDVVRLAQLEEESRLRAQARSDAASAASAAASLGNGNVSSQADSAFLIAELASIREAGARSRRVSSVSYADLGLARHDGSRIRADSVESDHHPLLDSAASMGSRQSSPGRSRRGHSRNASVLTFDSGTARNSGETGRGSIEPSTEPPSYEDEGAVPSGEEPPGYESPVQTRAPELPAFPPAASTQSSSAGQSAQRGRGLPRLGLRTEVLRRTQAPSIEVVGATPIEETHGRSWR